MRHSIHQIRPGVAFHLFTPDDLAKDPEIQLVAASGRRVSNKDTSLAMERFQRCCAVRNILLKIERGN